MSAAGGDRAGDRRWRAGDSREEIGAPPPRGGAGRRRRVLLTAAVAVAVVVADQVTKSLAVSKLTSGPVHLVGPFRLELSYNSGIAFSLATGLTIPIVIVVIAVVAGVAYLGRALPSSPAAVAVGLVIGGAVGNLADRLFRGHHGAVIDFLYSGFWPTFNVADAAITCGGFLLAFSLWRRSGPRGASDPAAPASGQR